jgi:hypothetical protein
VGALTLRTERAARTAGGSTLVGSAADRTAIQFNPAPTERTFYPSRATAAISATVPIEQPIWHSAQETIVYDFDWADWLAPGDAVASIDWTITPDDGAVLASELLAGSIASVKVSGLFSGTVYTLNCRATSTGGLVDDRIVTLICGVGPIKEVVADADSTLSWTWDWSGVLAAGEYVVGASFTVSDDLTATAPEYDYTSSTVTLAAAFEGVETVQAIVTTSAGETLQSTVAFRLVG